MSKQDDPPSTDLPASSSVSTLSALVGARFDVSLTPTLLPSVVQVLTLLTALLGLGAIVAALASSWWLGLGALLIVPVVVLLTSVLIRIGAEVVLAVLSMNARVTEMADRLPGLESAVGGMANDMPKLGFLRLRPGAR